MYGLARAGGDRAGGSCLGGSRRSVGDSQTALLLWRVRAPSTAGRPWDSLSRLHSGARAPSACSR